MRSCNFQIKFLAVLLFSSSLKHFAIAFCRKSNFASSTSSFVAHQSNEGMIRNKVIETKLWSSTATNLDVSNLLKNRGGRDVFLPDYNSYLHPKDSEFLEKSINYYSKVMSEERRRNIGQVQNFESPEYQKSFIQMARKHYYAITKVKSGKLQHAENVYRKIINEIVDQNEENCDHAQLAVATLLFALLTQRMGDIKKTRSVFDNFFRIAVVENAHHGKECACCGKVLTAYALFEMKQGNSLMGLKLAQKALEFDKTLRPVLQWKQFRDALEHEKRHSRM